MKEIIFNETIFVNHKDDFIVKNDFVDHKNHFCWIKFLFTEMILLTKLRISGVLI